MSKSSEASARYCVKESRRDVGDVALTSVSRNPKGRQPRQTKGISTDTFQRPLVNQPFAREIRGSEKVGSHFAFAPPSNCKARTRPICGSGSATSTWRGCPGTRGSSRQFKRESPANPIV